jgi:imidazolonepropionase-like amidohydrolase
MQAAGMSAADVLVAATAGGARAMGRDDFGTVTAGKKADLAVLAADPTADADAWRTVTHVVRGGVLRTVEELAAGASGAGEDEANEDG